MTKRAVDPEKIFLHAVAFHYAWKILRTEMMKGPPVEANALAPPFGMLSAFTSELLLKCISCIEKGHSPRQHDLKVLFDMLIVQTRRRQMELYKGFRIRAYQGRGYGWPSPRSRFGGGRVLAITTTPMLSTLPRPPVTQRQRPPLLS
jgi:hypothetical protein